MKKKMLLAALAVAGSLTALTGVATAWECPKSVCGAGSEIEQIVGGIDIMPDPLQNLVRNGGYVLDQTTTRTWNDHVDPTLTYAGERLQPDDVQVPNSRGLVSNTVQTANQAADAAASEATAKAALVVAVAEHAVDEVGDQIGRDGAFAPSAPPMDEHPLPSVGLSKSAPLPSPGN